MGSQTKINGCGSSPNSSAQKDAQDENKLDSSEVTDSNRLPSPDRPPDRPKITVFDSVNEILLPNGQTLPPGTKQIVVHPYPPFHPMYSQFTAESYYDAYYGADSEKKVSSNNLSSLPYTPLHNTSNSTSHIDSVNITI